jgi:hypothetical protein
MATITLYVPQSLAVVVVGWLGFVFLKSIVKEIIL